MGDNLFLRDLIVYACLVALVLFVTKQNNMWGVKKGTSNPATSLESLETTV